MATEQTPDDALPCPCCGYLTLGDFWSCDICDVCFWEEDLTQLRYPWLAMGPNGGVTLVEAQANFQRYGAMDEQFRRKVRAPRAGEERDPGWRPADLVRDAFETEMTRAPLPDDLTGLFWWRPTYWRRDMRGAESPA